MMYDEETRIPTQSHRNAFILLRRSWSLGNLLHTTFYYGVIGSQQARRVQKANELLHALALCCVESIQLVARH